MTETPSDAVGGGPDGERRRRAASFDELGERYHLVRPGYPDDAVDWMLPPGARDVLDLGAGTGRLTDSLVARGLSVVAVDPSERLLAVLRGRHPGVRTIVGTAERLELPDASLDAVVVGQAWHWMDVEVASTEAARVLRPGGTLAMIWNDRRPRPGWQQEFDAIQDAVRGSALVDETDSAPRPPFGPVEVYRTSWTRELPAEDFLALYTTHSPFLVADEATQADRLRRWRALLDAHAGSSVAEDYATEARRARLTDAATPPNATR